MSDSGFFSFLDHFTYVDDDSSRYEINVGDNGFSYLDMMSEKKAKKTFEEKQRLETSAALDGSTRARGKLNISRHDKYDHDSICLDTDLMAILRDIEERRKKMSYFPFAAVVFVLIVLAWASLPFLIDGGVVLMLVLAWIPPALAVLLWNVWKLDVSRKHVNCTYKITGRGRDAFESLNRAFSQLSSSEQLFLCSGRKYFEDTRYSGGSVSHPVLDPIKVVQGRPPLVDIDFDVWHLRVSHRDIFFMPDHVLVFQGAQAGGLSYAKLDLASASDTIQASGKARVTHDCSVVGKTHRFVNNDGSPDKRFNNNVEIALVDYGVFCLSGAGLDLRFYVSSQPSAKAAPSGFKQIQGLAALPVARIAEERHGNSNQTAASSESFHDVLFATMCCVMVADGKASRSEKDRIGSIMRRANVPWEREIEERTSNYVSHLKEHGPKKILKQTCESLRELDCSIKEKSFIESAIRSVIKADGEIAQREKDVSVRLLAALSDEQ